MGNKRFKTKGTYLNSTKKLVLQEIPLKITEALKCQIQEALDTLYPKQTIEFYIRVAIIDKLRVDFPTREEYNEQSKKEECHG